jgi:L-asparaginase/Glu-tRNA(Gln) amidotransferase subunit D
MKGAAQSFLAGIIVIAVIFVLVRPGSQGPTLVTGVSNGLKGLVTAATGGGTWSQA